MNRVGAGDSNGRLASLEVQAVTTPVASQVLATGHYLGRTSRGSHSFVLTQNGRTLGTAVYGQPSREFVARSLWLDDEGSLDNTRELIRFYTVDDIPKNAGTWFLARTIKLLPPQYEMLVAFSDAEAGHHGGLYQAGSWLYTGVTASTPYYYRAADGTRVSKQTPWKIARSKLLPWETPADGERRVARERGWTRVQGMAKYRYVYPRTKRARKMLRLNQLPYPKPGELQSQTVTAPALAPLPAPEPSKTLKPRVVVKRVRS